MFTTTSVAVNKEKREEKARLFVFPHLWTTWVHSLPPRGIPPVQQIGRLTRVFVQRCCELCGETFQIERKRGRPRVYCFVCEPPGWQVVKVPHQSRVKLRRRRAPLVRIGSPAALDPTDAGRYISCSSSSKD